MTEHGGVPGGAAPGGVRVRFAPSPSGDLHVGNVRTAIYDWAFARSTGGRFVLRIEDTDQTRVRPEYISSAQETLRWLGLEWDEGPVVGGPFGPYLQSERLGIYSEWVERFLKDGSAYHCYCSQEELAERREAARRAGGPSGYDGHCRDLTPDQVAAYQAEGRQPVVRFRMPPGSTTFTDLVRGEITFDHAHVPDFSLTRADGAPLYTLAVAVDDVLANHARGGETCPPGPAAVYRAMGGRSRSPRFRPPALRARQGRGGSAATGRVRQLVPQPGLLPEAICNHGLSGSRPGRNSWSRSRWPRWQPVDPGPGAPEPRPFTRKPGGGDQRGQKDPRAPLVAADHLFPRVPGWSHPTHGRRRRADAAARRSSDGCHPR